MKLTIIKSAAGSKAQNTHKPIWTATFHYNNFKSIVKIMHYSNELIKCQNF